MIDQIIIRIMSYEIIPQTHLPRETKVTRPQWLIQPVRQFHYLPTVKSKYLIRISKKRKDRSDK